MYTIDINMNSVVVHANRLEKLRKSALPNAIRGTLNSMAFDVKQKTMPLSAEKHFVRRKPNFFKANSKVFMAKGYNLNTMKSVVAFTPISATYSNEAVKELEQQEHSGVIQRRTFVPMETSRSGNVNEGQVLPSNRLRVIKNIQFAAKQTGRNSREKFIKAAIKAGRNGFVLGNLNSETLFKITGIRKDATGKTIIKKTPLYSHRSGRSVRIRKATHFMSEASKASHAKAAQFFHKEAKRQFDKIFR